MKLTDIPVVFICPDHNEKYKKRKEYMFKFLADIGFKDISMFKSGTEKYPLCLAQAVYDVLQTRLDDKPFILLEDDIELSQWVESFDVDIPEDADAFYLGFGKYAGHPTEPRAIGYNSVLVEHISDKHIRVINMLGFHAIMFITERFKRVTVDIMKHILEEENILTQDLGVSRVQKLYNIYAYKYPFFYQSEHMGNNWYAMDATNFRF